MLAAVVPPHTTEDTLALLRDPREVSDDIFAEEFVSTSVTCVWRKRSGSRKQKDAQKYQPARVLKLHSKSS